MKRGGVYWAELIPRSGSERRGRRPVIVVSHDGFNETPGWRSIVVVPVSTSPTQASVGWAGIVMKGFHSNRERGVVLWYRAGLR